MKSNDLKMLKKIDAELLEVELQYETQLEYEGARSQRYFRLSKALGAKLSKLKRMRANLTKSMADKLSREQVYSIILAERKEDVVIEQEVLKQLEAQVANNAALMLVDPNNTEYTETFKALAKACKAQQMVINNKSRLVTNWIAMKKTSAAVEAAAREYRGALIASEILGTTTHIKIEDHPLAQSEEWKKDPAYMNTQIDYAALGFKPSTQEEANKFYEENKTNSDPSNFLFDPKPLSERGNEVKKNVVIDFDD